MGNLAEAIEQSRNKLTLPNCDYAFQRWDDELGIVVDIHCGDTEYVIHRSLKNIWVVAKLPFASDPEHYIVERLPSGKFKCNCPARVPCKHIKWVGIASQLK